LSLVHEHFPCAFLILSKFIGARKGPQNRYIRALTLKKARDGTRASLSPRDRSGHGFSGFESHLAWKECATVSRMRASLAGEIAAMQS
jgi:hypothetical protein